MKIKSEEKRCVSVHVCVFVGRGRWGSREMKVFVLKREIRWQAIFLVYVLTVVRMTAKAKNTRPLYETAR